MEIKVNIKHMGKRKPQVAPVTYNLPLGINGFFTVRELNTDLTKSGVETYNDE